MTQRTKASAIRFDATLHRVDQRTILRLPQQSSERLSSRGQVAVQGTINGHDFASVVEPDGSGGHWISVDEKLRRAAGLSDGDSARLDLESTKEWPEPSVPVDLRQALAVAPAKIQDMWKDITPMARWEWVRWVNATANADTRQRRVDVTIAKMNGGKRRPCCFDLSSCTDPELSKNGKLFDPV